MISGMDGREIHRRNGDGGKEFWRSKWRRTGISEMDRIFCFREISGAVDR